MITPEKINEWIKEVEARPASAPLLLKIISNRLRDLAIRNDELMAENIALLNGKRVEEYEKRIAHLEYQLELLRRHFGGELPAMDGSRTAGLTGSSIIPTYTSLLIYNAQGRLLRIEISSEQMESPQRLALLDGTLIIDEESPRLLAAPSTEELLAVYSSGRVASLPVQAIPLAVELNENRFDMDRSALPFEPQAGEILVCLVPIAKLALSEFLVQTTRRGCVKKISSAMSQSILANHYIGTGVKLPADQTLDLTLCGKDDRLILVSHMGYLLGLEVNRLPFSIEEAMRLATGDYIEAATLVPPGYSILVVTQIGKLIHRTDDALEIASTMKARGQPVFSPARREQGVRVIGTVAALEGDWGAALHQDGQITIHPMRELFSNGTIPTEHGLLAFTQFSRS